MESINDRPGSDPNQRIHLDHWTEGCKRRDKMSETKPMLEIQNLHVEVEGKEMVRSPFFVQSLRVNPSQRSEYWFLLSLKFRVDIVLRQFPISVHPYRIASTGKPRRV